MRSHSHSQALFTSSGCSLLQPWRGNSHSYVSPARLMALSISDGWRDDNSRDKAMCGTSPEWIGALSSCAVQTYVGKSSQAHQKGSTPGQYFESPTWIHINSCYAFLRNRHFAVLEVELGHVRPEIDAVHGLRHGDTLNCKALATLRALPQ